VEWEIMPLCAAEGLGMMAWSPLRGGWLSGKYLRSMQEPPDGTRAKEVPDPAAWSQEATWRVLDAVRAVAAEVGKTPAQVALNWLLRKPVVTLPIVGARILTQLEDNLGATGWALTPEQVRKLDDASALPLPPPYDYLARMSTAHKR
jgi:aryl-alcohol dehydrogenase-like predicted oxidoreductase